MGIHRIFAFKEWLDQSAGHITWSPFRLIRVRGRQLMIWGAEEESKMDLFFPRKCLLRIIFSWGRPFEIYFFLEKGLQIFFSTSSEPFPRSLMAVPLYVHVLCSGIGDSMIPCMGYKMDSSLWRTVLFSLNTKPVPPLKSYWSQLCPNLTKIWLNRRKTNKVDLLDCTPGTLEYIL